MKPKAAPNLHEPSEADIQHTAYLLWLESGQVPGRDLDNWLAAKELLRHQHGRDATTKRQVIRPIPPPIPNQPSV